MSHRILLGEDEPVEERKAEDGKVIKFHDSMHPLLIKVIVELGMIPFHQINVLVITLTGMTGVIVGECLPTCMLLQAIKSFILLVLCTV